MLDQLPLSVTILFSSALLLTIVLYYRASKSITVLLAIVGWTVLQSLLGLSGIYQDEQAMPPNLLLLGVFPALLIILSLFISKRGKHFLDSLDLKSLTAFHTIRIPVEMALAMLFYHGVMSVYVTFEGTNFDLFSGISAPLMAWYAFQEDNIKYRRLMTWNVICLVLLLNVVITAALGIPSPFQQLAHDQPNIAVLHFPFNLLPTVIVPLVLLAHLAAIRQIAIALKNR